MKYAICMLVHKKPALLEKIVKRLQDQHTEIFIHLDKKCNISAFSHIDGVTFIEKRMNIYWGGRSMVLAMYNLIEHVIYHSSCDYIIFVSGEDFPVITPDKYKEYINKNKIYIEYEKLPKNNWFLGGTDRIMHYYPLKSPVSFLSRSLIRLQKFFHIQKGIKNLRFIIYGGSQWIHIHRNAAEYILFHWKNFFDFFKLCKIPDEMIFQTILLNSPYKPQVINTNYRYLRYDEHGSHALYLSNKDVDPVIKSNVLFCRKIYDETHFENMLNLINAKYRS